MEAFFRMIETNRFRNDAPPGVVLGKDENLGESKEQLWGASVQQLVPARLTTAWRYLEDPLMILGGSSYRATEVRDRTFDLQKEALANLRGNRKLTKAKMGDALSSLKPNEDQTKVLAWVLYELKQIQTVCFDEEAKTFWTVPDDLCAWSKGRKTLWVSKGCDRMLEGGSFHFGRWISDREDEGWTIPWPIAEGGMEELKTELANRGLTAKPAVFGAKVKKEDYARALGRAKAVEHLG